MEDSTRDHLPARPVGVAAELRQLIDVGVGQPVGCDSTPPPNGRHSFGHRTGQDRGPKLSHWAAGSRRATVVFPTTVLFSYPVSFEI